MVWEATGENHGNEYISGTRGPDEQLSGDRYIRVIMMNSGLDLGAVSLSRASKQRRRVTTGSHGMREARASGLFNTHKASEHAHSGKRARVVELL